MKKRSSSIVKAVFFDVGGVLIRDDSLKITVRQARVLGVSPKQLQAAIRLQRGLLGKGLMSRREYLQRLCSSLERPLIGDRELKVIFPKRVHRYERNWRIARQLWKAGYIVGIITNDVPPHRFLLRAPLRYPPFRPIIRSFEVHSRKPERKIFRIAMQRARVKFSEAIFFDDKPRNVVAARKLGMRAFQYKNTQQLIQSLRKFGVAI